MWTRLFSRKRVTPDLNGVFLQEMALPRLKTVITRERFYKSAAVLFFHGEDGSAQAVKDNLKNLLHKNFDFDHIRIIYPQAPEIPYFVDDNQLRSVWFNRKTYSPTCPEQKDSIERSCSLVKQLVNDLVTSGTRKERIVLGGLDMGAQLAMHVAYR
jgi:predicted esterase